jgi:hypothetical protein
MVVTFLIACFEGWLHYDTLSKSYETPKHAVSTNAEVVYDKVGGTYSCHFLLKVVCPTDVGTISRLAFRLTVVVICEIRLIT